MNKLKTDQRWFPVPWALMNVIGLLIGSLLGATDDGLITRLLGTGVLVLVLGDLVFGACFGIAQWLVLQHFSPKSRARLLWWIPATMIGFMVGARLGGRFAPLAGDNNVIIGIAFGLLMGVSLGIVQWMAMQYSGMFRTARKGSWIPVSIVAWVLGESIAFQFDFQLIGVPFVALAIALVSGIALLWWVQPT